MSQTDEERSAGPRRESQRITANLASQRHGWLSSASQVAHMCRYALPGGWIEPDPLECGHRVCTARSSRLISLISRKSVSESGGGG